MQKLKNNGARPKFSRSYLKKRVLSIEKLWLLKPDRESSTTKYKNPAESGIQNKAK